MSTLKLREDRANIWEQMKALVDRAEAEGRDLSAEETATYERMESDLDSLGNRIEREEKITARAAEFDRNVTTSASAAAPAERDERDDYTAAFAA